MWHKYVYKVVLNYNTFYHTSIGCEPSKVLHGLDPNSVLDLKWGSDPYHLEKVQKMSSNKGKSFSKMAARTPCKPISNTTRIMI